MGRRRPVAIGVGDQPREPLPHGPVMLDQPLQTKSVTDERRHCLADGMVPFVTPTMFDRDITVGIAVIRVVYERF